MPIDRWFKVSLSLLVLDTVAGLLATSLLALPGFGAVTAFVLVAAWADWRALGVPHARQLWDLLPGIFLLFVIPDYLFLASSFLAAVTHLFLLLLIYKLFDLRTHRDVLWVYLFTFVLLFVAATRTTSVGFLGVFVGYVVLGTWSLTLLHLTRETAAAFPGEGPTILARSRVVTPRFAASSLGAALGCFAVTLTLFFLLPRTGLVSGIESAQRGARTAGYADRVILDASGPIRLDATVVMRVAFPHGPNHPDRLAPLRWRGSSLDTFNGKSWFRGDLWLRRLREEGDREFVVSRPIPGPPILIQEILLEPISGKQLFGAPRLLTVRGPFSGLHTDSGDGVATFAEIDRPVRYLAFSQPDPPRLETLPTGSRSLPPEVSDRYLSLPSLSPRVVALARQVAAPAPTPYHAALLVERYLTTGFVYRLGVAPTPGTDPLEDFLFTQRSGHCEYFAAGMAVMLRILGIPSRVVTGFQRGEWNELGRFYTVRQRDAHSWVEAYFPGSGWIAFDPSPRGEFESGALAGGGRIAQSLEVLRMWWARYVIEYNVGDQLRMLASLRHQFRWWGVALAREWERWVAGGAGALRDRGWPTILLVAGFGLLLLLLLCSRMGSTFLRRQHPKSRVTFYERMLRLLARRGFRRASSSTAREFAESLGGHPVLHSPVAEITTLYERVRFGQEPLAQSERRRVDALLAALRSVVARGLPAG